MRVVGLPKHSMTKNYVKIPLNGFFYTTDHVFEFEDKLGVLRQKLNQLNIKTISLNGVEILDVDNTINCIRGMSVNQISESEVLVEVE